MSTTTSKNTLRLETLLRDLVAAHEQTNPEQLERTIGESKTYLAQVTCDRHQHATLIETAIDVYADDDLEFDESPLIAIGENGAFISAWVWVSF